VLHSLLSLNHPKANLNFIATFLWCLWKERKDDLFGRKKTKPEQIAMHAKALLHDLEASPLIPKSNNAPLPGQQIVPKLGDMVSVYFSLENKA
jgi:hypothetical protein